MGQHEVRQEIQQGQVQQEAREAKLRGHVRVPVNAFAAKCVLA